MGECEFKVSVLGQRRLEKNRSPGFVLEPNCAEIIHYNKGYRMVFASMRVVCLFLRARAVVTSSCSFLFVVYFLGEFFFIVFVTVVVMT